MGTCCTVTLQSMIKMKECNPGKASAFRCKFPQCPLTVLHSYSGVLVFINHKVLFLGIYFLTSAKTSVLLQSCGRRAPRKQPHRRVPCREGGLTPLSCGSHTMLGRGCLGTATSQLIHRCGQPGHGCPAALWWVSGHF